MKYIYKVEYYSSIKKCEIMKFAGKCTDLESKRLNKVTLSQKE